MRSTGIATRISLAALVVVAVAIAIMAIGVMRVGADAFMELMAESGESTEHASEMFASSVTWVVVTAGVVGAVVAVLLGMLLARRIANPIRRLADAAGRTAEGDLRATAPVEGPEEIRALANAFNVMVDRLAEQDAIRRDFVANASHELRTPLTNLQGYLEALRDGVLPPDPQTFDSLREEVDRLGRLAASLDLLAGGADDRPMPEDVDLGVLVRNGVELARPAFARRSIEVNVSAAPGLVVHARRDELAQVDREPAPERGALHATQRPRGRGRRAGPCRRAGPGHEQRLGDPRSRPAPGLGALLPRRTLARPLDRRSRHRPGDREAARRGGRRPRWCVIGRGRDDVLVQPADLTRCVWSTPAIGPARRRAKSRKGSAFFRIVDRTSRSPFSFSLRASAPVQLLTRGRGQREQVVTRQVGPDDAGDHPRLGGGAERERAPNARHLHLGCRAHALSGNRGLSDQGLVHLAYPVNVSGLVNAIHETLVLLPTFALR